MRFWVTANSGVAGERAGAGRWDVERVLEKPEREVSRKRARATGSAMGLYLLATSWESVDWMGTMSVGTDAAVIFVIRKES